MNTEEVLETFGRFLMTYLRDRSFEYYDMLLNNPDSHPLLQARLHEKLAPWSKEQQEVVRICLGLAIDGGLHDFLFALEENADASEANRTEHRFQVLVDGEDVTTLNDGLGLQAELFGEDGWIAQYSQFPDFRDRV